MIFDRTQNDVDTAIRLRNEKVKTFQELTEKDIETLERGTITYNTLNRIEAKHIELQNALIKMGYSNINIVTKQWSSPQIFDEKEFERILQNTKTLRDILAVFENTPKTPTLRYHFENINDLEKILFDVQELIDRANSIIDFSWAINMSYVGLYFDTKVFNVEDSAVLGKAIIGKMKLGKA